MNGWQPDAALAATRRDDLRHGTAAYSPAVCVKSAESISEFACRGIAKHQFNLQRILGSRFGLRCDSLITSPSRFKSDG